MSYLDTMAQGQQNAYGGYTQMYRKQPQTQMGGSQIRAPMRISLDRMYGGQPTALPGGPAAPQWNIEAPSEEDYQGTAGFSDYDQYLEDQGWSMVDDPVTGVPHMMPGGVEGETYESSGQRYIYSGGKWNAIDAGADYWQYASGAEKSEQRSLSASVENLNNLIAEQQNIIQSQSQWLSDDPKDFYQNQQAENAIAEAQAKIAEYQETLPDLQKELDDLNKAVEQRIMKAPVDTEAWQTQMSDLMNQFRAGDINYIDENGMLDVSALKSMTGNTMSDWLADVLETSYNTGVIQSDFFDAEGNLVPELEGIAAYFESSPEAMDAWNQYNKRLMMHAIGSGQSVESAYYTEATANAVAGYGAQIADQVTSTMMNEMKLQYTYIANSFKNAMIEAGMDYDTEAFINDMNNAYAAIEAQYQMGIDEIAQAVAQAESAKKGSIFSGLFTFLINTALSFIPGL